MSMKTSVKLTSFIKKLLLFGLLNVNHARLNVLDVVVMLKIVKNVFHLLEESLMIVKKVIANVLKDSRAIQGMGAFTNCHALMDFILKMNNATYVVLIAEHVTVNQIVLLAIILY